MIIIVENAIIAKDLKVGGVLKKSRCNSYIILLLGLVFCIDFIGHILPIIIINFEEISKSKYKRPDYYYLIFLNNDESEYQLTVDKLQPIVDNLCKLFPVKNCPKIKMFSWSIAPYPELIDAKGNPIIIMPQRAVEIFDQKELEAIITHEYGHLWLGTYNQKEADKFAAEIVGKKYIISCLKKLVKLKSTFISVIDNLSIPPGRITKTINNEIEERIGALEK